MPYCTECGNSIPDNVNFCPSCGAKLNFQIEISVQETSPIPPSDPSVKPEQVKSIKGGRKIIDSGPRPGQNNPNIQTLVKKKKKRGCLGCLGKGLLIFLGILIIGFVIILLIPDSSEVDRLVNELPTVQKGQEIKEEIGVKSVKIGNLEDNNIQLSIPEKTFDKSHVKIDINEVSDAPAFKSERADKIGPVYNISIDQKSKRLRKPVRVRLKLFKPENIEIEHPDDFWISYFNGKQWDYFKPDSTDLINQFIEFDTYHFSRFSTAKPTKEERINDFAEKEAVSQWAQKSNNIPTKRATEQIVKQVLLDKLGIKNKNLTQDIVESILNEDDYTKLLVSYNDKNMEQFGQDLAILAGKKIVEVVKDHESAAKTLLGGVTEHASKINTGINITRALTEGNYEKAAKELSMEIINTYPVTRLFREAARITQKQINRWKDQELEAAYQVYRQGAKSNVPFWGYRVAAGDFNAVWDQMKGFQTYILRVGIRDYGIKHNIDISKLGYTALNKIRRQIKEDLRKEFIKRKKEEGLIEKNKAQNIKLIREFENAHLLSKGSFGYTDQTSFDQMLRRLFLVKDMILKDTGSKIGFSGINSNGIISAKRVARLIQIWYRKKGMEKYRKELVKLGYKKKEKVVKLDKGDMSKAISGTWEGYFQITKNKFKDSMTKTAAMVFKAVGMGEDKVRNLTGAQGVFEEPEGLRRKRYMKMVLKHTSGNKYNYTATIEGDEVRQTYTGKAKIKDGKISFELSDASGSFSFEGKVLTQRNIKGTFYIGSKMFEAAEGIWEIKKIK